MKRLYWWFTILSTSLLIFAFWNPSAAKEDLMKAIGAVKFNKGTIAPEFSIENLARDRVKLENFPGKVVLLDFWATW